MAHSRTAKKNIRKNEKRRTANRAMIASVRTSVKKARENAADAASLGTAQQRLDKAAQRNLIHPNKAARMKSRLAKAANAAAKKK